jgi:hypothetical protein
MEIIEIKEENVLMQEVNWYVMSLFNIDSNYLILIIIS